MFVCVFAETPPPPYQYAAAIDGKFRRLQLPAPKALNYLRRSLTNLASSNIRAFNVFLLGFVPAKAYLEVYHATQPFRRISFQPESGARCMRRKKGETKVHSFAERKEIAKANIG